MLLKELWQDLDHDARISLHELLQFNNDHP